nr:hypothetical protein CFP56_54400 [Quercus suber]
MRLSPLYASRTGREASRRSPSNNLNAYHRSESAPEVGHESGKTSFGYLKGGMSGSRIDSSGSDRSEGRHIALAI